MDSAGVLYAVVGGNAVASWVARVDPAAVRNTADVDLILRREDFAAASAALQEVGFVAHEELGVPMFLDGVQGGPRDALHILMAKEKVRSNDLTPCPDVLEAVIDDQSYRIIALEALVRMKLTAFRDKDRTHLRDLLEVGLIDQTLVERLPAPLGVRLQQLIDTPDG